MNKLRRGMVVDANLDPIRASETGKIRPCVIVTNDVYNARVPVIQVVPLTEWNEKRAESLPTSPSNPTQPTAYRKNRWLIACKRAPLITATGW